MYSAKQTNRRANKQTNKQSINQPTNQTNNQSINQPNSKQAINLTLAYIGKFFLRTLFAQVVVSHHRATSIELMQVLIGQLEN
jgi:hypothetical protein